MDSEKAEENSASGASGPFPSFRVPFGPTVPCRTRRPLQPRACPIMAPPAQTCAALDRPACSLEQLGS
eukprot:11765287-Alexandrium_andersonii.AAC.1